MLTMRVIGHRGACGVFPENTLISIVKAVEYGVDAVEFDVRMTSDRVLILFHDEKLQRLTGVKGLIREKTYNYISRLKVKGEKIPTLREVLEYLEKTQVKIFIEIKEPDVIDDVLNLVESYKLKGRVYVVSFYHKILNIAKNRDFKTGAIFVCRPLNLKNLVKNLELDMILPRIDMIDKELVSEARRLNLEIGSWVINDEYDLERARRLNLDWIATDYPDKIIKMLKTSKLF
ncbi:MAG: glycerophosphodiester phosphodiesterase [Thermoprotei archaeon ex4572_64]|nr:MAG: glycerophosphodiester phosphodiesterase [Thermoprotei archaeon ex4572_64]